VSTECGENTVVSAIGPTTSEAPTQRYDLALVVRLAPNQVFFAGGTVTFDVIVANQGDVASGPHSAQLVVAAGTSAQWASHGAVMSTEAVAWPALASLAPGEQRTLQVGLRLDAIDPVSGHRVLAEISGDSGEDWDSSPDFNPFNDVVVDNDDIAVEVIGEEDDHDVASISAAQVRFDNQQFAVAPTAQPSIVYPTDGQPVAPQPAVEQPAVEQPAVEQPATPPRSALDPASQPSAPVVAALPVAEPDVALRVAVDGERRLLPVTGGDTSMTLTLAVVMTLAGAALTLVRRRQWIRQPRDDS
jgi:LPXTG-motif cell wall-anchored protein